MMIREVYPERNRRAHHKWTLCPQGLLKTLGGGIIGWGSINVGTALVVVLLRVKMGTSFVSTSSENRPSGHSENTFLTTPLGGPEKTPVYFKKLSVRFLNLTFAKLFYGTQKIEKSLPKDKSLRILINST
jgi:hypothetical protein